MIFSSLIRMRNSSGSHQQVAPGSPNQEQMNNPELNPPPPGTPTTPPVVSAPSPPNSASMPDSSTGAAPAEIPKSPVSNLEQHVKPEAKTPEEQLPKKETSRPVQKPGEQNPLPSLVPVQVSQESEMSLKSGEDKAPPQMQATPSVEGVKPEGGANLENKPVEPTQTSPVQAEPNKPVEPVPAHAEPAPAQAEPTPAQAEPAKIAESTTGQVESAKPADSVPAQTESAPAQAEPAKIAESTTGQVESADSVPAHPEPTKTAEPSPAQVEPAKLAGPPPVQTEPVKPDETALNQNESVKPVESATEQAETPKAAEPVPTKIEPEKSAEPAKAGEPAAATTGPSDLVPAEPANPTEAVQATTEPLKPTEQIPIESAKPSEPTPLPAEETKSTEPSVQVEQAKSLELAPAEVGKPLESAPVQSEQNKPAEQTSADQSKHSEPIAVQSEPVKPIDSVPPQSEPAKPTEPVSEQNEPGKTTEIAPKQAESAKVSESESVPKASDEPKLEGAPLPLTQPSADSVKSSESPLAEAQTPAVSDEPKENSKTEKTSTEKPEDKTMDNNENASTPSATPKEENAVAETKYILEISKKIVKLIDEGDMSGSVGPKTREELKDLVIRVFNLVTDKSNLCEGLDRQNCALINQIHSLKSVVSITKDLLNLRNMEVEHLQRDMQVMEESIAAERTRHNELMDRLKQSMELNEKLKNEYQIQQKLFLAIKDKYHEKVEILSSEKQRLEEMIRQTTGEEPSMPQAEVIIEDIQVPPADKTPKPSTNL